VNFDQCVAQLEALSGELVEVLVRGREAGSRHVADFWGVLSRMGEVELTGKEAEILAEAVVETAVTFIVGDGYLSLLPSRYVGCSAARGRRGWFEVETLDATILVGPKRPAWFD
jgi:hypothetical protein